MTAKNSSRIEKKAGSGKEYAPFSMVITWTYNVARKKGKPKQTYRDDITTLEFENNGVKVKGLHPIAILYKKYLLEKLSAYSVVIYDNRKPVASQVVFRQVIQNGVTHPYEDFREDYFDIQTGKPHPKTPFQIALENDKK